MKLIILLGVLLALTSCGTGGPLDFIHKGEGHKRQHSTTDPAFLAHIQAFEAEAATQLSEPDFKVGDIPINFGIPSDPNFVGVCYTYANNQREVIIRKDWWERSNEKARQALIFHELGHCRLDRGHNDEVITEGNREIRLSIMHSRMVYLNDYARYQNEYHRELFTQQAQGILSRLSRDQNSQGAISP